MFKLLGNFQGPFFLIFYNSDTKVTTRSKLVAKVAI